MTVHQYCSPAGAGAQMAKAQPPVAPEAGLVLGGRHLVAGAEHRHHRPKAGQQDVERRVDDMPTSADHRRPGRAGRRHRLDRRRVQGTGQGHRGQARHRVPGCGRHQRRRARSTHRQHRGRQPGDRPSEPHPSLLTAGRPAGGDAVPTGSRQPAGDQQVQSSRWALRAARRARKLAGAARSKTGPVGGGSRRRPARSPASCRPHTATRCCSSWTLRDPKRTVAGHRHRQVLDLVAGGRPAWRCRYHTRSTWDPRPVRRVCPACRSQRPTLTGPLGIPVVIDRCHQARVRNALEPSGGPGSSPDDQFRTRLPVALIRRCGGERQPSGWCGQPGRPPSARWVGPDG